MNVARYIIPIALAGGPIPILDRDIHGDPVDVEPALRTCGAWSVVTVDRPRALAALREARAWAAEGHPVILLLQDPPSQAAHALAWARTHAAELTVVPDPLGRYVPDPTCTRVSAWARR